MGRGGGYCPRLNRACLHSSQSRGPGQARRGPQPASPARGSRLSPSRRGSGLAFLPAVQRDRRRRRALLTRSSTASDRLLKSGRVVASPLAVASTRVSRSRPGPRNVTGWRGAFSPSLVLIGSPAPLTRGPLTLLRVLASHPFNPVSIRAGGGREWARVEREGPMRGRRGGREVGSAAGLPAGQVQPMGAPPTSPAQERPRWPLAFQRVSPTATPGLPVAWKRRRLERRGRCGEAGPRDGG